MWHVWDRSEMGKIPAGRPGARREDNIKIDFLGMGWEVVDCISLAQDKYLWRSLVNIAINLWVP
jgi:hypothetical protein